MSFLDVTHPQSPIMSSFNGVKGDIDHTSLLADQIGQLYASADYSDVSIIVQGKRFPAHKIVLATRSEYFRALLYGGLRETEQSEIELKSANSETFEVILQYIYTGHVSLSKLKEDVLLDVLGMCHEFGFIELETSVGEYLKEILNVRNVCLIFDSSRLYQMRFLSIICLGFIDSHAKEILQHESFANLSAEAVSYILQRDSFFAPEVDIFRGVHNWYIANPERADCCKEIFKTIRLPLMRIEDLLEVVRPTGLISSEDLLDAIQIIATSVKGVNHRGSLLPEINVASSSLSAIVLQGDTSTALLDGNNVEYDMERGYTRHSIVDCCDNGIVIRLGIQSIINHFKMLLWDKDLRSYSYYIEVSVNQKDWTMVIDHRNYFCRSWQYLYFPQQVVQYIRIVGTNNTVNKVFHVVSFEAMFTRSTETLKDGIIEPTTNVASTKRSATVIEGVSRSRNTLLNGNISSYDWDLGYTCHQLGSGCIMVQLGQPYYIGSLRLLLWDLDGRHYCYYVETSINGTQWEMAIDRRATPSKSWQSVKFKPRPVVFIKIIGTHNSANEVFHCVHLECPAIPSTLFTEPLLDEESPKNF